MYEPMHPQATFTVEAESLTKTTTGKRKMDTTAVGTYLGGFEDLSTIGMKLVETRDGRSIRIIGRSYAAVSLDPGVLIGHVIRFTDPATGQARVLRCMGRRGPFDASDDDDHFEVDMGSEQAR